MKLLISYDEVKDIFSGKIAFPIDILFVGESKFQILSFIRVPIFGEKTISLILSIKSASLNCVQLNNESGNFSNVVLNVLEKILEKFAPNNSINDLFDIENETIKLYPNVIDQVRALEQYIVLNSIDVVEDGFVLNLLFKDNN